MQRVTADFPHALFDSAATRRIEQAAMASLPAHTLMKRAGLAVARLALALAPHARTVWIACGPGNNGGDGLECALHLHRWGKAVVITWLGDERHAPPDTVAALARVRAAGLALADAPPDQLGAHDLAIDALLGLGRQRAPQGRMADWITRLNAGPAPVLAIDLPTGLQADTGALTGDAGAAPCVHAHHTLCLLTLKPGLFTGLGRDAAGQVWLDPLGLTDLGEASANLIGPPPRTVRAHASHKGSFGDVAVIGGAPGMTGAALLAASAALHGGAGRVFVGLLGDAADPATMAAAVAARQPELMLRRAAEIDLASATVVCGCGGGEAVKAALPSVLDQAPRAVIDADALNAIAGDASLQARLAGRASRGLSTVLTPHPLEAARLIGISTAAVQADRLAAAVQLAARYRCAIVLKGSGTVVAAPGQAPGINPTGNARLATAGTGDVLAGLVGAHLAAGHDAFDAAGYAVYAHGLAADRWPDGHALTAGDLAAALQPAPH